MQRLALTVLLFGISTSAQDSAANPASVSNNADATAISATVRNYIEAYYTGDSLRMKQTMHPHYLKHMIHGDIPMREKTAAQMERYVRANGPSDQPQAEKTEQIQVLDIAGNIASAKLITPHWVDYMTLSKLDGQWKILSVVQRIED